MVELEEEEEKTGCYTTKKKEAHMYHHSVMPCLWPFREAVHNLLRVVYTPSIGGCIFRWAEPCVADGSKDRPHISLSTGYYRSPENEKSNHHIQFNKNNNLRNKMVEQTNHKVLSTVVNKLLCPLLAVLTAHMRLNKQLHWARLTSKRRTL